MTGCSFPLALSRLIRLYTWCPRTVFLKARNLAYPFCSGLKTLHEVLKGICSLFCPSSSCVLPQHGCFWLLVDLHTSSRLFPWMWARPEAPSWVCSLRLRPRQESGKHGYRFKSMKACQVSCQCDQLLRVLLQWQVPLFCHVALYSWTMACFGGLSAARLRVSFRKSITKTKVRMSSLSQVCTGSDILGRVCQGTDAACVTAPCGCVLCRAPPGDQSMSWEVSTFKNQCLSKSLFMFVWSSPGASCSSARSVFKNRNLNAETAGRTLFFHLSLWCLFCLRIWTLFKFMFTYMPFYSFWL